MIAWTPRETPLPPTAVAARGDAAKALVAALLKRDLSKLRGVAEPIGGRDIVIILGPEEALPWVPEAVFLGSELGAPSLLLPTTEAPPWPVALFERAVRRRTSERLVAVLAREDLLVPVAHARPLDRTLLEAWRR